MKKIILSTLCCIALIAAHAQDAKKFYEQGLEKAQAGELEEAITLFSKAIELQPEDYFAWYNRGIDRSMLQLYEEALPDFDKTIQLAPDYKKAWLNRGTTKKRMTDYTGALADYSQAIRLDENYGDAYYNRGLVYDLLSKTDSACADFTKASSLGMKAAQRKVDKCNDTTKAKMPVHAVLRLSKTAGDDSYGFSEKNPVKVGTGPDSGPANQHAYLQLLRDAQGKPISYERLGSCCPYPSEHGMFGRGLLDKYEITYLNEKGKQKKATIYISFYDYEEPQILYGFKTIGQK